MVTSQLVSGETGIPKTFPVISRFGSANTLRPKRQSTLFCRAEVCDVSELFFKLCSELNSLSAFPDAKYPTFADYYQQKHNQQISNTLEPLLQVFRLSRPK